MNLVLCACTTGQLQFCHSDFCELKIVICRTDIVVFNIPVNQSIFNLLFAINNNSTTHDLHFKRH